jgi:hypothetical protein
VVDHGRRIEDTGVIRAVVIQGKNVFATGNAANVIKNTNEAVDVAICRYRCGVLRWGSATRRLGIGISAASV